jgi:hypothetical protein
VLLERILATFQQILCSTLTLEGYVYVVRVCLVEVNGLEPMTSCLQSRRSPS